MSSPSGGKKRGFVGQMAEGIERGVQDIGSGLQDIAGGQVERGVERTLVGSIAATTAGLTEVAGITRTTTTQKQAAEAAAAETTMLETEASTSKEKARLDAINKRIEAEVALRLKTPGIRQTLLTSGTSNLYPGGRNTLLTTGRTGK